MRSLRLLLVAILLPLGLGGCVVAADVTPGYHGHYGYARPYAYAPAPRPYYYRPPPRPYYGYGYGYGPRRYYGY